MTPGVEVGVSYSSEFLSKSTLSLVTVNSKELPPKTSFVLNIKKAIAFLIIDSSLDHTKWTTCIVVAKKFNPYRYKSVETALNQTDWYYQLATIKKLEVNPRWFAENDICHYEESANINPEGEF